MLTEQTARDNLHRLLDKYEAMSESDRRLITEDGVIRQFIDILLRDVLGWPIEDPARYKYELRTDVGRPDVTLIPQGGSPIFLEAKRFGVIKELKPTDKSIENTITPGQMALPGMSVDRTPEEQQAINYAFGNNSAWAILTNFEKLRLFNARRDWLVLSFERPSAYLDNFDLLWQLAYPSVLNGSLDVLSSQRHTEDVDKDYLAFINEWRQKLAEEIVQRASDNPWVHLSTGQVDLPLLRSVVQRFLDRLVIIRFAEDHLVIPPGTLRDLYEVRQKNPYTFTMNEFVARFFRRFDQQHNSALFAPGPVDAVSLSDDALLPLISKLYEARYRAMPADILGNTYEQYLGKALVIHNGSVITRDNLETRKKQGSYYTPQVIVRHIVDHSLGRYLYGTQTGQPTGDPLPGATRKTAADIRHLRVLDSACGSGSFLIYAYQVLERFYRAELERIEREAEARRAQLAAQGTVDPLDLQIELTPFITERDRIRDYPRLILEHHLYGVDLDPQAAEIAVVNLMMRAMEGRHTSKRLPLILNQNVKVGNALVGLRPDDPRLADHRADLARIRRLRADLIATPHGAEHDRIIHDLQTAAAALNATFAPAFAAHFTDPDRVHPFHWGAEFPEVFYDADGAPLPDPGFDIIIGNPPWEILKPDLREFYAQFDDRIESKLNRRQVEQRIEELDAEDPRRRARFQRQTRTIEETAAWVRQADDYTRQGRGDTATHKLFTERMYTLLRQGGRLGYVVPSGIYTDLGTKDLRQMLLDEGNIQYIYSFSNERFFFPGVDHRFKFALIGAQKGPQADGFWAAFRFNPRVAIAPDDLPAFLADERNLFYMRRDSLEKFSPDSLGVMEFQNPRDYAIADRIYADHPKLGDHIDGTWNVKFTREFDKTNDRSLFNYSKQGLPIFEGENLGFYGEMLRPPTVYMDENKGRKKLLRPLIRQAGETLSDTQIPLDYEDYRFGFRRIARSTDIRTLIVSYLPKSSFAMYTLTTTVQHYFDGDSFRPYMTKSEEMFLYTCMASFVLDYMIRFQVAASVAMFNVYSLPVPRLTAGHPTFDAIVPRAARLTCTRAEFADLWQQVMGSPWDAASAATDPAQRQRLRDEIDALVARLYRLTRAEFDHILGTFPLVFPDTEAGRARRAALLDTFDTTPALS